MSDCIRSPFRFEEETRSISHMGLLPEGWHRAKVSRRRRKKCYSNISIHNTYVVPHFYLIRGVEVDNYGVWQLYSTNFGGYDARF